MSQNKETPTELSSPDDALKSMYVSLNAVGNGRLKTITKKWKVEPLGNDIKQRKANGHLQLILYYLEKGLKGMAN